MMTFLGESPVVERLGWVLVHSLWQLAAVALVAAIILRTLRGRSAELRYWIAAAALFTVAILPVVTWPLRPDQVVSTGLAPDSTPLVKTDAPQASPVPAATPSRGVGAVAVPATSVSRVPIAISEKPTSTQPPAQPWWVRLQQALEPWLPLLVAGWSLGVLAFALRPLVGWVTVRRLRRVGVSPAPDAIEEMLRRTAARLGLRRAVAVVQSTLVHVPIVIGYFRPLILLPLTVVTGLPASQLEAILAHELAHVRRHDYVVNLVQTLIETLCFYHPAVWWLSRRIRDERENCCDDLAVAALGDRVNYGRALLAIEELRGSAPALALGANDGSLLNRIRRLAGRSPDRSSSLGGVSLVSLAAVAAVALAVQSGTPADEPVEPADVIVFQSDVTDRESGAPIPEATVKWRIEKAYPTIDSRTLWEDSFTSDTEGKYVARVPKNAIEFGNRLVVIEASHRDYLPINESGYPLYLPDADAGIQPDHRHLKLERGTEVTGRFVLPDGSPARDMVLMVARDREGFGDATGFGFYTRTDSDGRYRLVTEKSWPQRLHWFPQGHAADSRALTKTFGDQGTIKLKTGSRIRGRIEDREGKPLSGIVVQAATGTRVPLLFATSDEQGRIEFTPSPAGEYRLLPVDHFVDLTGRWREAPTPPPFDGIDFVLANTSEVVVLRAPETVTVRIKVVDAAGRPLEGRRITDHGWPPRFKSTPVAGQPGVYEIKVPKGQEYRAFLLDRQVGESVMFAKLPSENSELTTASDADGAWTPGHSMRLNLEDRDELEATIVSHGVRVMPEGRIQFIVRSTTGERVDVSNILFEIEYVDAEKFRTQGTDGGGFTQISKSGDEPGRTLEGVVPGLPLSIKLSGGGYKPAETTVEAVAAETKTVEIVLEPGSESGIGEAGAKPENGLMLVYDIPGDEPVAQFHLHQIKPAEGGSAEPDRDIEVANGSRVHVKDITPGQYQIARIRPISFGGFARHYWLDYRIVDVAADKSLEFVSRRVNGKRVRGVVLDLERKLGATPAGGRPDNGFGRPETRAAVLVRHAERPADIPEGSKLDATHCGGDGSFVTAPLEPGTYVLDVEAFLPLKDEEQKASGVIAPTFVGSATVVVSEDGEPEAVAIKLEPFRLPEDDGIGLPGGGGPPPGKSEEATLESKPGKPALDQLSALRKEWREFLAVQVTDDATFFRRASLDLTGTIPTVDDLRKFLDDSDPAKRTKLVERLVESESFSAYQSFAIAQDGVDARLRNLRGPLAQARAKEFGVAWGAFDKGLQAGVSRAGAGPEVQSGQRLPLEFYVRNVGDKTVQIQVAFHFHQNVPAVRDSDGNEVKVESIVLAGSEALYTETLRPGDVVTFLHPGLGFGENPKPREQSWYPFIAEPRQGTYQLTQSARISVRPADDDAQSQEAALTSGPVEFEVVAAPAAAEKQDAAVNVAPPRPTITLVVEDAAADAIHAVIKASDAATGEPIKSIRIVPSSIEGDPRHVTWQSQYVKDVTDGPAEFRMERGWNQTVLRIEAAGYRPVVTEPLPRNKKVTLELAMTPDPGLVGTVLTPEGKPAEGASVAVCTWTNEVTVENGGLRYGHHAEKLRSMGTTDVNGTFRTPTEVDEWVLVAAHASGYAEVTAEEFAKSSTIELKPWGRVDGEFFIGGEPQVGQKIQIGAGRGDVEVVLHYSANVTTDSAGKFSSGPIPPVRLYVSPLFHHGESDFNLLWFSASVEVKPGDATRVSLPSAGQPLVGRVTLPDDAALKLADLELTASISLRPPRIGFGGDDQGQAAYAAFMQSEAGKTFQRGDIAVNADGTFRIEGLPETTYILTVTARRNGDAENAAPVGSGVMRVTLPQRSDPPTPFDAGEVRLTLRPPG